MKTAISLPDDLFVAAEALASEQHLSRSRLYAAALREYLARHQPDRVTATLNAVYANVSSELEPDLSQPPTRSCNATSGKSASPGTGPGLVGQFAQSSWLSPLASPVQS